MKIIKENILGIITDKWKHKSCVANFGVGEDWATLYNIESSVRKKGHATELLIEAKAHYEKQGKKFGGSVALSAEMKSIYKRLNIEEFKD